MRIVRLLVTRLAPIAGIAFVTAVFLQAGEATMSVADVRPGMTGIGRTVFDGTHVEEFRVNIIGVLENVIGTHRNLILARLEGGPLANTGVIAGMSGSPVYIDGRLVGAVSYSLGQFSKEPIAGITPIDEMIAAASLPAPRRQTASVDLPNPLTPETLRASLRQAFSWVRPFAESPSDVQVVSGSALVPGIGALLRPIATPITLGGFASAVADPVIAGFRDQGFREGVDPNGGMRGEKQDFHRRRSVVISGTGPARF